MLIWTQRVKSTAQGPWLTPRVEFEAQTTHGLCYCPDSGIRPTGNQQHVLGCIVTTVAARSGDTQGLAVPAGAPHSRGPQELSACAAAHEGPGQAASLQPRGRGGLVWQEVLQGVVPTVRC